jgi:hypothetical protein
MSQDPSTSGTAGQTRNGSADDAAVEFLTALQPKNPSESQRAFNALLRSITREASRR